MPQQHLYQICLHDGPFSNYFLNKASSNRNSFFLFTPHQYQVSTTHQIPSTKALASLYQTQTVLKKTPNLSPLGSSAFPHAYFQAGSLKHGLQPPLQQHTKHAASSNSGHHLLINHLLSTSAARNPHIGPFSLCMTSQMQSERSSLLHSHTHTTNAMQHVNTLLC